MLPLCMYRGNRTFVSTCNKYRHPDDVTLGAIIGMFVNTYLPLFLDPTKLLTTCSAQCILQLAKS